MTAKNADIIIVGAGICGLTAAVELVTAGEKVLIIEAKEKAGGRISTFHDPSFGEPIELGAEFIHGNLQQTFKLIKKYNLKYQPVRSDFRQERNGELVKDQDPIDDSGELEKKLKEVTEDITVNEFLEKNFPIKEALKNSVRKFVEGYDAADPEYSSVLALRDEWVDENWEQYRIEGGYEKLIEALLGDFFDRGGEMICSENVKEILWDEQVKIITDQNEFDCSQVLVTVPLSILQEELIKFSPAIPEKTNAAKQMGFGSVIKFILRFEKPFWEEKSQLKKPVFLISRQLVPTWWTHAHHQPLITGWLGGPVAKQLSHQPDEELLQLALGSLEKIFQLQENSLSYQLKAWKVTNWQKDPYTLGAYTYSTVNSSHNISLVKEPINNMLFFAGEALHTESGIGTVEAAICSALEASGKMLGRKDC